MVVSYSLIFTGARRLKFTTAAICSISEAFTPHARGRTDSSSASSLSSAACRLLPFQANGRVRRESARQRACWSANSHPADLFAKVTESISVYPTICDAPHRASLHAYGLPYDTRLGTTCRSRPWLWLLLLGRELPLWIYRTHRSKYEELHSDGWIEQYQCEDEDGEFTASWFCLRFGGLPIPRLSGYLCSGRLLKRARFSEKSRRVMLPASDEDAARIATFNRLNHVLLGLLGVLFAFEDLAS
jgi:hypothetical protein